MKDILASWKQKLTTTRVLYEGPVQIPLESADMKVVLDEHCPEEFAAIHKELQGRTPTHVLLTVGQLESLLSGVTK